MKAALRSKRHLKLCPGSYKTITHFGCTGEICGIGRVEYLLTDCIPNLRYLGACGGRSMAAEIVLLEVPM